MKTPTLFVLAAGMGSRYGGLKQLDPLGPNGETIMDYSVYDAVCAGFGKVVFVIRHDFEKEFDERVLSRYKNFVPVEVVFQSLDKLPEGYTVPEGRTKPWGTGQAVLMGADVIREPFAVINADDFYGRSAFEAIGAFLSNESRPTNNLCMVAYSVGNTMSRNGSVARGVCTVDKANHLRSIVERHDISYAGGDNIVYTDEATGENHALDASTPVSMNLWGFGPEIFDYIRKEFVTFLSKYGNEPKREFYIPSVVDMLIARREVVVDVLHTPAKWFGVTYATDRDNVVASLKALHDSGEYPEKLF